MDLFAGPAQEVRAELEHRLLAVLQEFRWIGHLRNRLHSVSQVVDLFRRSLDDFLVVVGSLLLGLLALDRRLDVLERLLEVLQLGLKSGLLRLVTSHLGSEFLVLLIDLHECFKQVVDRIFERDGLFGPLVVSKA